jgi:hypothetical protein
MPHFHVLEGPQIWMTFYFNFFHSVDNEIIVYVSSSIGRKLHIRTYSVEISNETPLKPQMKCRIFMYLKGRKFEWLFIFIFFHSVDNEIIVSFKFFRPKITHSFVLGWNFKRNLVETPKEMPHFHVLEGPQIWMTFYFNFFHSVDNEIIVSFQVLSAENYTFVHTRLKFKTKPCWNPKWNIAFSCTWRAANLNDYLFLFFS